VAKPFDLFRFAQGLDHVPRRFQEQPARRFSSASSKCPRARPAAIASDANRELAGKALVEATPISGPA